MKSLSTLKMYIQLCPHYPAEKDIPKSIHGIIMDLRSKGH